MSTTEQKPIAELSVLELAAELGAAGIQIPSGAKKDVLVKLVEAARTPSEPVAEPEEAEDEPEEIEGEVTAIEEEVPVEPPTPEVLAAESQALELRQQPVVQAPALIPSSAEFTALQEIAARISGTQMVPLAYRGKPDDVIAAFLTGREMGMGIMQSLREIHVIDGKPSLSANLLLARLREGGIMILESESTAQRAWIHARRRDSGETGEVEWTYEEAEQVTDRKGKRLVEKDNWKNYPADMLWARAVGRLARHLGPDLVGGAMPYTSEEVEDWDDFDSADADRRAKFGDDHQTGIWHGPVDWVELGNRFARRINEVPEWLGQVAELFGYDSLNSLLRSQELAQERKEDLWKRLNAVLRSVEDCPDEFMTTEQIRKAFSDGFDGVEIAGPEPPEEAQAAAAAAPAEPDPAEAGGPTEPASEAEPTAAAEEGDDIGDIPF